MIQENGEELWLEDKGKNEIKNRQCILCNAYNIQIPIKAW